MIPPVALIIMFTAKTRANIPATTYIPNPTEPVMKPGRTAVIALRNILNKTDAATEKAIPKTESVTLRPNPLGEHERKLTISSSL